MKTHNMYQACLIHQVQNEDGEFAFLALGDAHAVASWRKLSGQDAEPPFARKLGAGDNSAGACKKTQAHSACPVGLVTKGKQQGLLATAGDTYPPTDN